MSKTVTVSEGTAILKEICRLAGVAGEALTALSLETAGTDPNAAVQAAMLAEEKAAEGGQAGIVLAALKEIAGLASAVSAVEADGPVAQPQPVPLPAPSEPAPQPEPVASEPASPAPEQPAAPVEPVA